MAVDLSNTGHHKDSDKDPASAIFLYADDSKIYKVIRNSK